MMINNALVNDYQQQMKHNLLKLYRQLQTHLSRQSKILLEEEVGYSDSIKRFSKHSCSPWGVFLPHCVDDIQTAMKFCRENAIRYVIRGGGTNQANTSLIEQGLVIDFSKLKQINSRLQANSLALTMQAGVNFNEIEDYLSVQNRKRNLGYTFPLAWHRQISCIGAHTIFGNGLSHRKTGFGVDLIESAKIVLYDGRLLTASSSQNSDLLWAIKGAGPFFGAIVQVTERLSQKRCNILDSKGREQVKVHSYEYKFGEANNSITNELDTIIAALPQNCFPMVCMFKSKSFSAVFIQVYELLYNKVTKEVANGQQQTEDLLNNYKDKYGGKTKQQRGFTYQTAKSIQIPNNSEKKLYYELWGGLTTLSKLPLLIKDLRQVYQKVDLTQFIDDGVGLAAYFNNLDGETFQQRDERASSWPGTKQTTILVWGNVNYHNIESKDRVRQIHRTIKIAVDKHVMMGSSCDWNPQDLKGQVFGKYLYRHHYKRLKKIKGIYDPEDLFCPGVL